MRWGVILLLVPGVALAQEAPVRMLGEKWTTADGLKRRAALRIMLDQPETPSPDLIRPLLLNQHDFPVEQGPYPQQALAGEQGGRIRVVLTVSDTGLPTTCAITQPSRIPSLDAHACPHILRHVRFFPVLMRDGNRVGVAIEASLRYSVTPWAPSITPWAPNINPDPTPAPPVRRGKRASPLTSPDLAMLEALKGRTLPPQIGLVGATLKVEADGRVSACTLYRPTQIDAVDKALCDNLTLLRFTPATDGDGESVAVEYFARMLLR